MKPIRLYIILSLALIFSSAQAQILQDSAEVYNAKSARYFYANDFWDTVTVYHDLDTSIARSHQFNNSYKNGKRYQDLGVMGTAIKPVFKELPAYLGYQPGYNVYDFYQIRLENVKFYDTKSPFSCIDYVQSTAGEAAIKFDFSVNINKNWNTGFTITRSASKHVYGKTGNKRLDKFGDDFAFNFYSAYRSKNSRYGALISFATMRHMVYETGGVKAPDTDYEDSIKSNNINKIPVWFNKSATTGVIQTFDNRTELNIYQQFHIDTTHKFGVFLQTDLLDRVNGYTINPDADSANGYFGKDRSVYNKTLSDYSNSYRSLTNTMGLKWGSKLLDAKVYYKIRNSSYDEITNLSTTTLGRIYLDDQYYGALANIKIAPKIHVALNYETQAAFNQSSYYASDTVVKYATWKNNNDMKYGAVLKIGSLQAGYKFIRYSPSIQQTFLDQNHYRWGPSTLEKNNFDATDANELFANWQYYSQRIGVKLNGRYVQFKNLIYCDTNSRFVQNAGTANLLMLDARVLFHFSRAYFDLGYTYGQNTGEQVLRVPDHIINPIVYYSGAIFKKELKLNIGIEATYMTAYKADAYNVGLQAFYLQNRIKVQDYWNFDFFVNTHFRKTDIFLKLANFTQLFDNKSYYVTPNYPGMVFNFTFGIKWYFYN